MKTWLNNWFTGAGHTKTNIIDYKALDDSFVDDFSTSNYFITGYHGKYDEMIFALKHQTYGYGILVYNESLNIFTQRYHDIPRFIFSLDSDMYNFYDLEVTTNHSHIFQMDLGSVLVFNSVAKDFIVEFIVNGQNQEQNTLLYSKIFEALELESDKYEFDKIIYTTEYQTSTYNLGDGNTSFWLQPEYFGNKWRYPIMVTVTPTTVFPGAGDGSGDEYFVNSDMKGTWLKVRLEYADINAKFLKSIITDFTPITD